MPVYSAFSVFLGYSVYLVIIVMVLKVLKLMGFSKNINAWNWTFYVCQINICVILLSRSFPVVLVIKKLSRSLSHDGNRERKREFVLPTFFLCLLYSPSCVCVCVCVCLLVSLSHDCVFTRSKLFLVCSQCPKYLHVMLK